MAHNPVSTANHGHPCVRFYFHSTKRTVVFPITAEVYVEKILNRDEFRRHCDKYKTREAILANLK